MVVNSVLTHALASLVFSASFSVAFEDTTCASRRPDVPTDPAHSMLQVQWQRTLFSAPQTANHSAPQTSPQAAPQAASTKLKSSAVSDRLRVMPHAEKSELQVLGSTAALDDSGLHSVLNTRCQLEIELFLRRIFSSLNLELCEESRFLRWLPDVPSIKDFDALTAHITNALAPAACAFMAPAGLCPRARRSVECGDSLELGAHRRRQCNARIRRDKPVVLTSWEEGDNCVLPNSSVWCEVRLANVPPYWMAVYDWNLAEDWVSYNVCQTGYWEDYNISEFGPPGHMLDIGGNIGYHTFAFAAAGWNVTSFEPMGPNFALMNATLCQNPELVSKVRLNHFGLGTKTKQCKMMAPARNVGDGFTRCADEDLGTVPASDEHTFQEIGQFSLRRLDEVLAEQAVTQVDLVKIDVEGYEHQVFAGAPNFLAQYRPRLVKSEVWDTMVGSIGPASGYDYLAFFEAAGYQTFEDRKCQVPTDAKATLNYTKAMDVVLCFNASSIA